MSDADAVLRTLSVSGGAVPPVRVVRLHDQMCELYVAAAVDLPSPWTKVTNEMWQAPFEGAVPSVGPAPLPALVQIGRDEEGGRLLLNLEYARCLQVAADDPRAAREVLAGLVVDAALSEWADTLTITLLGAFPDLEDDIGSGRIRYAGSVEQFLQMPPVGLELVVVAGPPASRDTVMQRLSRPGVMVLTTDTSGVAAGRWKIRTSRGGAFLEPLGVMLGEVQRLPAAQYQHLLEVADLSDDRAFMPPAAPEPVPGAPMIQLLGPPEIRDAAGVVDPARRPRLLELAAYLALHPGCTSTQLDESLWPGRATQTRRAYMSKLRAWLGQNPQGQDYLPGAPGKTVFALLPEVGCDVQQWRGLVGDDPRRARTEDLAAAVQLVRGAPFAGVDRKRYAWADGLRQDLTGQIADAFEELASRYADLGLWRDAQQVACRGLDVEPADERLWRARIECAVATGNRAALAEVRTRLEDLAARHGELDAETLDALDNAQQVLPAAPPGPVEPVGPVTAVAPPAPAPPIEQVEQVVAEDDHLASQLEGAGDLGDDSGIEQEETLIPLPASAASTTVDVPETYSAPPNEPDVQILGPTPVAAPAQRARRRRGALVGAAALTGVAALGAGVWLATSDVPVVASDPGMAAPPPNPISEPEPDTPARPGNLGKVVAAVPAPGKWTAALKHQQAVLARQRAQQEARRRAQTQTPTWTAPSTPVTTTVTAPQPAGGGTSGGGGPSNNSTGGGGSPSSGGGVVIKPDTAPPPGPPMPDQPNNPTNPDGQQP